LHSTQIQSEESDDNNNAPSNNKRPREQEPEPLSRKTARAIGIDIYNELVLKVQALNAQIGSYQQENSKLKHALEQQERELNTVLRIESNVNAIYKEFSKLAKSRNGDNEQEQDMVQERLKKFTFMKKDYFMNQQKYDHLKLRIKPDYVMKSVLQMLELDLDKYCMPGDRKTKRTKLRESQIQDIINIAKKFTVFTSKSDKDARRHIGKVFTIASKSNLPQKIPSPTSAHRMIICNIRIPNKRLTLFSDSYFLTNLKS